MVNWQVLRRCASAQGVVLAHECTTLFGKGPQPLLWGGLQAEHVKITTRDVANLLSYYVTLEVVGAGRRLDSPILALCGGTEGSLMTFDRDGQHLRL